MHQCCVHCPLCQGINHCNLKKICQNCHFPTKGNNTLDHSNSNIRNAYTAEYKPHFGKSDHVAILQKFSYTKQRPVQSQWEILTSGLRVHWRTRRAACTLQTRIFSKRQQTTFVIIERRGSMQMVAWKSGQGMRLSSQGMKEHIIGPGTNCAGHSEQQKGPIFKKWKASSWTWLSKWQRQVLKALKQVTPRKPVGPEGVLPRVLKANHWTVSRCVHRHIQSVFNKCSPTHTLKISIILLVPKKLDSSILNDFKPVSLMPMAMKCFEKLVLKHINSGPWHHWPSMVCHLLQQMNSAIPYNTWTAAEPMSGYSSWIIVTIRPGYWNVKLADLEVPTPTCSQILDFLTDRPQVVLIKGRVSSELKISTGV